MIILVQFNHCGKLFSFTGRTCSGAKPSQTRRFGEAEWKPLYASRTVNNSHFPWTSTCSHVVRFSVLSQFVFKNVFIGKFSRRDHIIFTESNVKESKCIVNPSLKMRIFSLLNLHSQLVIVKFGWQTRPECASSRVMYPFCAFSSSLWKRIGSLKFFFSCINIGRGMYLIVFLVCFVFSSGASEQICV